MIISGYTVYTYFSNGGSMSAEPDYYSSNYFGEEYQKNVVQLLHMVQAIENRGAISEDGLAQANQDLIKIIWERTEVSPLPYMMRRTMK